MWYFKRIFQILLTDLKQLGLFSKCAVKEVKVTLTGGYKWETTTTPQPDVFFSDNTSTACYTVTQPQTNVLFRSHGGCGSAPSGPQVIQVTLWSRQVCWRIGATAEVLMAHSPRRGTAAQLCSSACHVTLQSWLLKEFFNDFFLLNWDFNMF